MAEVQTFQKSTRTRLKGKAQSTLNAKIHERDNHQCVLCQVSVDPGEKYHHIVLKSQGGSDEETNGATLCMNCHVSIAHGPRAKEVRVVLLDYIEGIYGRGESVYKNV